MNIGPTELIIVLLIVLLLFGGAKLPKLARSLGQAQKEFKSGLEDTSKPEKPEIAAQAPPADSITMSKADLEALIAEREAKARREATGTD
jgi:sec-independent protein translocase protein TatA